MAKIIAIFNNKGGVGKSTLTVFLADFLSSLQVNQQQVKVLVIDLDPQNSSAIALLGLERVLDIKQQKQSLSHLIARRGFKASPKKEPPFKQAIDQRHIEAGKQQKKLKLGDVDVMISDENITAELEEKMEIKDSLMVAAEIKKELNRHYDFILIDLPSNISLVNRYALIGAFLAEYFIIPVEPNRINVNALPNTLNLLEKFQYLRQEYGLKGKQKLLGLVLNKTDKRTKQYRLHYNEIVQYANQAQSKVYREVIPPNPKLSTAVDDSLNFTSIDDRYDSYYDAVRRLVVEMLKDLGYSLKRS